MAAESETCELCKTEMLLFCDEHAYVRHDNNSLSPGHVLVIPRCHVSNFFDMTLAEKMSVLALMDRAKAEIDKKHSPEDTTSASTLNVPGANRECTSMFTSFPAMPVTLLIQAVAFVVFSLAHN